MFLEGLLLSFRCSEQSACRLACSKIDLQRVHLHAYISLSLKREETFNPLMEMRFGKTPKHLYDIRVLIADSSYITGLRTLSENSKF